ncbi:hypothetical protein MTP99_008813 [Tenebrio molitor]|nr:hypothetical protein MTP99_008813 [Tenebrio molitor]
MSKSINPVGVQKLWQYPHIKTLPGLSYIMPVSLALIITFCILIGLGITAKYSDCDPFITKQIAKDDQLTPYYVMDFAEKFPGFLAYSLQEFLAQPSVQFQRS